MNEPNLAPPKKLAKLKPDGLSSKINPRSKEQGPLIIFPKSQCFLAQFSLLEHFAWPPPSGPSESCKTRDYLAAPEVTVTLSPCMVAVTPQREPSLLTSSSASPIPERFLLSIADLNSSLPKLRDLSAISSSKIRGPHEFWAVFSA